MGFYEELVHQLIGHAHSVQLIRFVLRPRAALFLQVMIDRTCCGTEVGWREDGRSLGLAIKSRVTKPKASAYYLGSQISKHDIVMI